MVAFISCCRRFSRSSISLISAERSKSSLSSATKRSAYKWITKLCWAVSEMAFFNGTTWSPDKMASCFWMQLNRRYPLILWFIHRHPALPCCLFHSSKHTIYLGQQTCFSFTSCHTEFFPPLTSTASTAWWLSCLPQERKIHGSNPGWNGIFPGQVIRVTQILALQWLPCQAPVGIGSPLGLVGPVSVYCDWVR